MIDKIIGRTQEKHILDNALHANEAQLLAVYGRRRVGKTFLISEFFAEQADLFTVTGMNQASLKDQLENFKLLFHKKFPEWFG